MPPASSHLAESPVPAPPPTMSCPLRILALSRSRICCRVKRAMEISLKSVSGRTGRNNFQKVIGQGLSEGRIVDVHVEFDQPAIGPRPKFAFQGVEQHAVGRRVVEGFAGSID